MIGKAWLIVAYSMRPMNRGLRMKMQKPMVTLANGRQVSWDEFSRWGAHQQRMGLNPHAKNINWGISHSEKMRHIVKASYENGTRKSNWNFGAKNGQSKAITTPAGEFPSIKATIFHYKITSVQLKKWMNDNPSKFFYSNTKNSNDPKKSIHKKRPVNTPDGIFPSIKSAARHFNVGERTIKTWIRSLRPDEFEFI